MDTRLKILALLPLLLIAVVLIAVSRIDLERFVLRPAERRMLHFSPDKSEMGIVQPVPAAKGISLKSMNFSSPEDSGKETPSAIRTGAPPVESVQKQNASVKFRADEAELPDRKENTFPGPAGDDPQKDPRLTFVVLNDNDSMVIMNDHIMHEGDSFGNITVRKIEQERVLIGDKILRWIYMEEEK